MKKVKKWLLNTIGIKEGDTIVLGNSGGPDSMCLLNILLEIRESKKINIVCAHINHNLREESAKELEFLRDYCNLKNVTFDVMTIEKYGDDNFHNQARKIRYRFYEELVSKYNANYIMTAHHGDDLVETILMRLTRGSTLRGYAGFNMISDYETYKIVRPLTLVTKEEIMEYDERKQIPYVTDKSNFKEKYTRNRYRKTVLPFLKKEEKKVHEKFLKFSETLDEYDKFINKEIKKTINRVYKDNTLDIEEFKVLDELIAKKIVYFILEAIYKDDLLIVNNTHVDLIIKCINSKRPNSKVSLPNNIKAIKSYNFLVIKEEIRDITSYEIELIDFVSLPNGHTLEMVGEEESNNNNVCRIDSKEVEFPLYVRTRKLGDKMLLKKVDGYKKVKDIFIDCKVPIDSRDLWPLVVDSNERIIWIPGLKKSKFTKQKNELYDIILRYD